MASGQAGPSGYGYDEQDTHPRVFNPALLNKMSIILNIRKDDNLSIEPILDRYIPFNSLIDKGFRAVPTTELRGHHFTFSRFCEYLAKNFKIPFNPKTDQLFVTARVDGPDRRALLRMPIQDEKTFHNAVAYLHDTSTPTTSGLDVQFVCPNYQQAPSALNPEPVPTIEFGSLDDLGENPEYGSHSEGEDLAIGRPKTHQARKHKILGPALNVARKVSSLGLPGGNALERENCPDVNIASSIPTHLSGEGMRERSELERENESEDTTAHPKDMPEATDVSMTLDMGKTPVEEEDESAVQNSKNIDAPGPEIEDDIISGLEEVVIQEGDTSGRESLPILKGREDGASTQEHVGPALPAQVDPRGPPSNSFTPINESRGSRSTASSDTSHFPDQQPKDHTPKIQKTPPSCSKDDDALEVDPQTAFEEFLDINNDSAPALQTDAAKIRELHQEAMPKRSDFKDEKAYEKAMEAWNAMDGELSNATVQNSVDQWKCSRLSEATWRITANFFHHDENQKSCKLPGCVMLPAPFERGLLPEQAHSIVNALLMVKRNRHLLLGHGMGLGKTTIVIAMNFVQHRINLLRYHIDRHPDLHLPINVDVPGTFQGSVFEDAQQCPLNKQMHETYGFDCPCSPRNLSYFMAKSWGVTVVMVPLTVISDWQDDWCECYGIAPGAAIPFDENLIMQPILVTAHGVPQDGTGDVEEYMSVLKARVVESDEGEDFYIGKARLCNSRCLVVTTANSFHSQLVRKFQTKVDVEVGDTNILGKGYWWSLVLNYLFFDEAHLGKTDKSPGIKGFSHSFVTDPQNKDIHLVPVSGTLVTGGLQDLAIFITCFMQIGNTKKIWKQHPILKNWVDVVKMNKAAKSWVNKLKSNSVTDEEAQEHVNTLKPVFEELCFKFTPGEHFLDAGPCVVLPPHKYREIPCYFKPKWIKVLDEFDDELRAQWQTRDKRMRKAHLERFGSLKHYVEPVKDSWKVSFLGRLFASFPFLSQLEFDDEMPKFTQKEWQDCRKTGDWTLEDDMYSQFIDEIAESSAKLEQIRRLIKYFDKPLIEGSTEKPRMIFVSYFMASTRIVYLFLTMIMGFSEDDVLWVTKGHGQAAINAALKQWHAKEKNTHKPRFLVGTTSVFNVGLTLTEALALVLLEPDYRVAYELQLFARNNRLGQKNPYSLGILLYNAQNQRETTVLERNRLKKFITRGGDA
ncbi:hypothetical protein V8E51_003079 [Hyaloscypha variabilis]